MAKRARSSLTEKVFASREEVLRAIDLLSRRVKDIADQKSAKLPSTDGKIEALELKVSTTVRDIFGASSPEYADFQHVSFYGGPMSIGMQEYELQHSLELGYDVVSQKISALVDILKERAEVIGAVSSLNDFDSGSTVVDDRSNPRVSLRQFETAFCTYKHRTQIGNGGSGTVIEVENIDGDLFALKYLSPEEITSEKLKRFRNELAFCEKTRHPNIVRIVDKGFIPWNDSKLPFYVMPRYPGNMRHLMSQRISHEKILHYLSHILDGVEAAHLNGVIHRDIKPENILHDADNDRLVIADFGIAHFTEAHLQTSVETKPGSRLANYVYAAPEQRVKGSTITPAADIYAVGLILNELFTGAVPFGTDYRQISQSASSYAYLDDIVAKMLKQNPQSRPQSVSDIKRVMIGKRNAFIREQRLSRLTGTVISDTTIDDPLYNDPPQIDNVEWKDHQLIFHFSRPLNSDWIDCFHQPGSHTSLMGCGPSYFHFSGSTGSLRFDGSQAQQVVTHAKQYTHLANNKYRELLERRARESRHKLEQELQRQIELEEKAKAINASIQL